MDWQDKEFEKFLHRFELREPAPLTESGPIRVRRPRFWLAAAIALPIAVALVLPFVVVRNSSKTIGVQSVAESTDSIRKVQYGEIVNSKGSGALLELPDGSRAELRSDSELALERADDGVRIRLKKGSLIVTAAKQHAGHLYVKTRDVSVSAVGTMCLVNAEEAGSRVAVIQGEVRVQQGATLKKLFPGDQVATNPVMPALPVVEQIQWSRDALVYWALLQAQNVPPPPIPSPIPPSKSAAPPAFEVASVKQSFLVDDAYAEGFTAGAGTCARGTPMTVSGNRVVLRWISLCGLIQIAYDVKDFQITGMRDWMTKREPSIFFDIDARAAEGESLTADRAGLMLRALLADRFELKLHRDTGEVPVYALVVNKNGPKLSIGTGGPCANGRGSVVFGLGLIASCRPDMTMPELAQRLSRATDRPVIDETGLDGKYAFELRYSMDGPFPSQSADLPSLFTALQEQLGLRLEAKKMKVDVLVIDQANRPSPN